MSASARLRKLESVPAKAASTPEAKKNQRICKEAFTQLKALNQKILSYPSTCVKRRATYLKNYVTQSYRLGRLYGGKDRLETPDPKALEFLKEAALKYKKTSITFHEEKDYLTDTQLAQIGQLAHYPEYVELCKKDSALLKEAFNWILNNNLSVRVLVEFPNVASHIDDSYLKGRIACDPSLLKFHENRNGKKDVTLAFDGKDVSILDKKRKVIFSNGLTHTIESAFKVFKKKNTEEGHLAFFPGVGIVNYDQIRYGPLNPKTKKVDCTIDFNRPDWYRQFPMKAHLTQEEATKTFGFPCDGKNWVITAAATRQDERFDIYSGHSFIRIAIPREDGTYDYTWGFGQFAKKYTQNAVHAAGYLFAPKHAAIQYPDNNEFYSHRQLKEVHFSVTPEKGGACLDSIKNDMIQSRSKNLIFQYLIRNCTYWSSSKLKEFVGEKEGKLFELENYLKLEPTGFLGGVMKILRNVKDWFRRVIMGSLAILFCGWKKMKITREDGTKEVVNVFKTPPWDTKRPFYHPGAIFRTAPVVAQ